MKRDDLLGFSFGGNKCRIAASLMEDMENKQADFMVSYGSRKSNLNRVIVNLCKSRKIPCLVISSVEGHQEQEDTFNASIIRDMGIESIFCEKSNVAETVERTLEQLREQGFSPYYIYGNKYGVGNEAAARKAYRDAYLEIRQWQKEHALSFDQIFLASGTGMTQGGLLAGQMEFAGENEKKEEIIGISVARDQAAGTAAVQRYAGIGEGSLCGRQEPEIHFLDGYRCGGYGCFDAWIEEVIRSMMENHGIALDPTYTGKAYAGMLDWLETHGTGQETVLFLHTGGMPLYFDYQACR